MYLENDSAKQIVWSLAKPKELLFHATFTCHSKRTHFVGFQMLTALLMQQRQTYQPTLQQSQDKVAPMGPRILRAAYA